MTLELVKTISLVSGNRGSEPAHVSGLRAAQHRGGGAMSVEHIERKAGGYAYRVRWPEHGRNRARSFTLQKDAPRPTSPS
jgi:hypothetical protein